MQRKLESATSANAGAVMEGNPRYADERLPDHLETISQAFSDLNVYCSLPKKLLYGYVFFQVKPKPGMLGKFPIESALKRAQWCMYTPPNGSDQIKVSDQHPKFMICEIPTAWEKDMIVAHIACLLLILDGKYHDVISFLRNPDSLDLKVTISNMLNKIDLPKAMSNHIEQFADRLISCHYPGYKLLNIHLGTQIMRRRQDKRGRKKSQGNPSQPQSLNSLVKFM